MRAFGKPSQAQPLECLQLMSLISCFELAYALQGQYWSGQGPHQYVSILEFADAFEKSAHGRSRYDYMSQPFDTTSVAGKDPLIYDTFALNCKSFSIINDRVYLQLRG